MRGALPLVLAGTCLAILPVIGPAGHSGRPSLAYPKPPCASGNARAGTPAHDWIGSLQGWADSPAVLAYRTVIARAKGLPAPAGC